MNLENSKATKLSTNQQFNGLFGKEENKDITNDYYIYLYYCGENLLYIGYSKHPCARYYYHTRNFGDRFKSIDLIKVCSAGTMKEAKFFESYYIAKFEPLFNKRDKICPLNDIGIPHYFKEYTITEFINAFQSFDKINIKKKNPFVYNGKTYKYESAFIREQFPSYNIRTIRALRSKIQKKENCNINKAYNIILSKPIASYYKSVDRVMIANFILSNPKLTIPEVCDRLDISYHIVRGIRERLITNGILPVSKKSGSVAPKEIGNDELEKILFNNIA